jgi:hypothetical protein
MPLYHFSKDGFQELPQATMADLMIRERQDLQQVLRDHIQAVAPDVLIISEEYSEWEDSKRRIDLLGIDGKGSLVVFELKRTSDGGHMDLQAIRYASMVASLNFTDVIEIFEKYLRQRGLAGNARELITNHLGGDEDEAEITVAEDVRIVLVSEGFGTEITTAALWLNEQGLDIRCVRLQPYEVGDRIVFDIQQLIPLPEANDLMVKRRQKEARQKVVRNRSGRDFSKYRVLIDGNLTEGLGKRRAILAVVTGLFNIGVSPQIMRKTINQSRQRFYEVEGLHATEEEFIEAAENSADLNDGKRFDARRYFTADEELFRFEGKTYVFSTQWGTHTEQKMKDLVAAHGADRVSFEKEGD